MEPNMKSLIFMDVEAASFSGFPIEVGWAEVRLPGLAIGLETHLIRHDPWLIGCQDEWSMDAQRVHGISQEMLIRDGEPVDAVVARLAEAFGAGTVYSDAPQNDFDWILRLHDAAGVWPGFRIRGVNEAFVGNDADRFAAEWKAFKAVPAPHRAALDAYRWALLWTATARPHDPEWRRRWGL
jgi:hypothetical protein